MTVLWTPPSDVREKSRIGDFMRWLGRDNATYVEMWEWSTTDLTGFWRSIWEYFDVIAHSPYGTVVADASMPGAAMPDASMPGAAMPGAKWFPGATLNYAEHVLRMPGVADDDPIVLSYSQTRAPVTLTKAELIEQVRRARAGLVRMGVGQGDRVAAYLPNIPETFILFLAAASLGAIFSSCAPEFGTRSVTDRWAQISPTVLVNIDGYRYGDKVVDRRAEVEAIRAALPSLKHTITLSYLDGVVGLGPLGEDTDEPLAFAPLPFDHPLYVLYSSGTTGLPKPIVHGHGGILLEHLKMLALHHDLGPGDRFFWFSTTGWMM